MTGSAVLRKNINFVQVQKEDDPAAAGLTTEIH